MVGKDKKDRYRYYYCAGRSLPRHLRDCNEPFIPARIVEEEAWKWLESLCTQDGALEAALRELEQRNAKDIAPKQTRLTQLDKEIDRERRAINIWVKSYPDASSDEELEDLKANVKTASNRLEKLRKDRDNLASEIQQGTVSQAQQRELVELIQLYREEILNADYETKRFMFDRFKLVCRLRYDEDGTQRLDMSIQIDEKEVAIVTTAPRSALPATRAPRCDSRPAPRSRAGRSA
jgi:hypothetical protein